MASPIKIKIDEINNMKLHTPIPKEVSITSIKRKSAYYCCAYLTFKQLLSFTKDEFIKMMIEMRDYIFDGSTDAPQIRAWANEYDEIVNVIIPILSKENKSYLNFHLVFEYEMPLHTTDASKEGSVYPDVIIVADNGTVVLEFKQRKVEAGDIYSTQATKYYKRLKIHSVAMNQKTHLTYTVCTKEKKNELYTIDGFKYRKYWYGNARMVSMDLCTRFFCRQKPIKNIERWVKADFLIKG